MIFSDYKFILTSYIYIKPNLMVVTLKLCYVLTDLLYSSIFKDIKCCTPLVYISLVKSYSYNDLKVKLCNFIRFFTLTKIM